ncbi:SDR family NAD(P)-dependent oxidoreductase [Alcanivorax profundi]|uniref:SDR family NAD(P)-dependent oxidoreductase n=1 Tax=Alcanivorax profundi TaxID=2338368 RepID=UPI0032B1EE99
MKRFSGKTALITGASSGMGKDYARLLAAAGAHLALTARREDRLVSLRDTLLAEFSVDVLVLPCDLMDPVSRQAMLDALDGRGVKVDILINNAGLGLQEPFVAMPWGHLQGMMDVDMTALTHLTHHFSTRMQARGEGYVLLVASVAGHMAIPGYAGYSACKHYVRALGYALNGELRPAGVRVTVVSPGATETEFFDVAGHQRNLLAKLLTGKSEAVAWSALKGLHRGRREVVPGLINWLATLSARLLPYTLMRRIMEILF